MIKALSFQAGSAAAWDKLVHASPMGTFLHTRRFLSYHRERFRDQSLVLVDAAGRSRAVLPAAMSPNDDAVVVSHPGATYGGLVFEARNSADAALELMPIACKEFARRGFTRFIYKSVPAHLHAGGCQADLYALWRCGATLLRRDLWNVLDLRYPRRVSETRRQAIRLAEKSSVEIADVTDRDGYAAFWSMLSSRLKARHRVSPVHSLEEMWRLAESFPEAIRLRIARSPEGQLLAGTWLFAVSASSWHTQYIASAEDAGQRAVDLLLDRTIVEAQKSGVHFFSFGCSTEQGGAVLNSGLFNYKAGFGAGSFVHDFYEIDLLQAH